MSESGYDLRHEVLDSTSERMNPPLLIVEMMREMLQPAFSIIALMVWK
jgi:hypothetical protein